MFFFPVRKQLEFACEKCSDFAPTQHPIQRALFTFSAGQLTEYLREHKELRELMVARSGDKRYGPATIIMPTKENFLVGRFNSKVEFKYLEIQSFDNITEAAADYILLNWNLPRLRPTRTEQRLKIQWGSNAHVFLNETGRIVDATNGRFKYYDEENKKFTYYD